MTTPIHPDWPPLPLDNCSRQDVIDSFRELYSDFLDLYREHKAPGTVGFPDYVKVLDYVAEHGLPPRSGRYSFQTRVYAWLLQCFGAEISHDKVERVDRFIEEALELAQSLDYPKERVLALVEYVYARPKGHPPQELGGVMVTLAALCTPHQLDMSEASEAELARILQPAIVEKIRRKQAAKPTGSALPTA